MGLDGQFGAGHRARNMMQAEAPATSDYQLAVGPLSSLLAECMPGWMTDAMSKTGTFRI